jgi:glycerophosphoryl diester phosphodiesterase
MKKLLAILILAAILSSMIIPINAETNLAIYVCDGGSGDGTLPSSPVGTLEKAYELIFERSNVKSDPSASATIVICSKLTVADHFNYDGKISHKGEVTFTSAYGGNDFRISADARLLVYAESKKALSISDEHRFVLGGPTQFENLTLDRGAKTNVPLTIYASTCFFAGESFKVVNTNWNLNYTEPARALTADEIDAIVLSAHRGFQPEGPENTALSFEAAGKHGFDYIETDVLMTADGELVCIHDSTLDRTTNGSGKVHAMTYAEILQYRIDTAAYGFDIASVDSSKLYVPTFREYLQICKKYGAKPFIELKSVGKDVIKKTIDTALEYFAPEDIVISSSSLSLLQISYNLNRDIFCHLIWGDQTDAGYEKSIRELSKMTNSSGKVNAGIAFNIQGLSDSANFERAEFWINKAKSASLLTCLRAADDMKEIHKMFELGIDYYPTNTTSPEKLSELGTEKNAEYAYTPSDGGKLFIRGGRRSETTKDDISLTLLGGIFDFVSPSNAEAPSSGNYRVMIGGNAFVSRLVMGETCKYGTNIKSARLSVDENATIRELYVTGDYANTENVTIEINSGNVESLIHSRNKGGTASNLDLILTDVSLLPKTIDIFNTSAITGQKVLTLYGEAPTDTSDWDNVVFITPETDTKEETSSKTETGAHTQVPPSTEIGTENKPSHMKTYVVPAAVLLVVVLLSVIVSITAKSKHK